MKTYLHGPTDYAKSLKLPEGRGKLVVGRKRKETQMCPCGKAIESRTHIVGEREMYKDERDV